MKEYVINVEPLETRIALLEDKRLTELAVERQESRSVVGNIYKGRVDSVVQGIQAAFVDIGFEKNGFLYISDIATPDVEGDFVYENGTAKAHGNIRRSRQVGIEKILRKGQEIMVQVSKDTLGTKGVRLTNYVTLPGRYVVYMPTVNNIGISRKIEDEQERDRLKKILQSIRPKEGGLILRTAGEGKQKADFLADLRYVTKLWEKIKSKMNSVKAPCLLHEDLSPILRLVRDCFTTDIQRLTIDSETEYSRILSFLDGFAPNLRRRVRLYRGKKPLFDKMELEGEIEKALQRKVPLKSGGYLYIDQTEALIAIDVNSGRFTGTTHLEETAFRTNIEAAEEIARQVRLRDLGGIIVIDFIDMQLERNRKELIRKLSECLKKDRAQTTISEISELGMIEMTRKRVRHNLLKALSQPCPYCDGSGMVRSVTTVTFSVLRRLRSLFSETREKHVILQVHPDVARRLKTENKDLLDAVSRQFERNIEVESVSDFHIRDIRILNARTRSEIPIK
ncbi:MAG TPA: Rne/Rng family ribonuclease [Candidatus Hydrogenedentes bacterium]|nr:Rne/Rng family ribonuclease [Candidatus Hydrogenedentota bacterium]HOL76897.1 Rne/Rng family ribonuclease [Candidatus Hydrogenedentota bacterium]HPO85550.1 Rne/Rng family ribonuclease [Candidatus Hydrogenedentota bacterium]